MKCGSAGLPAGAIVNGKVNDPNAVGVALKQLLARTEINEARALVAVSDAVATFRVLRMPVAAKDQDISPAVGKALPMDQERIATAWLDLGVVDDHRVVHAVAWDRALVKGATDAVKRAGLEPLAVELKSACLARAVPEPSCVILDLSSNPVEILLVDRNVPQIWNSFELKVPLGDEAVPALAAPLRSVLRFYSRQGESGFGAESPVLISGEQVLPSDLLTRLASLVEQPVAMMPPLARVPPHVRHTTYMACLGLIMRRSS